MVRKVVLYGEDILKQTSKEVPVEQITTPEFQQLIKDMEETMHADNGCGLAAPQVGIPIRLIVFDIGKGLHVFINPRIVRADGEQTGPEGCLSIPGLQADVTRAMRVTMKGLGPDGKELRLKGKEMLARVMQHEYDHLDGILFIDKAIPDTMEWNDDMESAKKQQLAEDVLLESNR